MTPAGLLRSPDESDSALVVGREELENVGHVDPGQNYEGFKKALKVE